MNKCNYCRLPFSKDEKENCLSITESTKPVNACAWAELSMAFNKLGHTLRMPYDKILDKLINQRRKRK